MIPTGRKISHEELATTLPLPWVQCIVLDTLEAIAEGAEQGSRVPEGVEFWYHDGELLALAQADVVEAGFDHSGDGVLLAEWRVGTRFERCITCGQEARESQSSWCSRRCRDLLRPIGRREAPGVKEKAVLLAAAERWALERRATLVGWWGPLTREIAERLYPPTEGG